MSEVLRALLGLAFFCAVAWALSSHRRRTPWRILVIGLSMQIALAWLLLRTGPGRALFETLADWVRKLISMGAHGGTMVFGPLADPARMEEVFPGSGFILAFAGSGLVVIIFFSALMAVLYHLGIMQVVIWALARSMSALMGVSGAESMAMAANMFVGQTEAPLVIRPYLPRMTGSELNALMTGGFATIAGSVMAAYMGILGEDYAPHLLTASVMSAPAAFVIAKIMQPETVASETSGKVPLKIERSASNLVEAATNGTTDGLKLYLNVVAMLIAFVALINLLDWPLGAIGTWFGFGEGDPLTLRRLFGWVFAPISWLIGVQGWHDCQVFGSLLGTKVAVNEFVAFVDLGAVVPGAGGTAPAAGRFQELRSAQMAAYALCGFANFASVGIQIGGISALVPERKRELAGLALRAMLGGAFASWMTATVAGMFL